MTGVVITQPPGRPGVPPQAVSADQALRDHALKLNNVNRGWVNVSLLVTLATGVTSSTVQDVRIAKLNTAVLACPTTKNAAVEIASGNMYYTITDGQVVINHTSAATADRTFQLVLIG